MSDVQVRYCSFCPIKLEVAKDGFEKIIGQEAIGHIVHYTGDKLYGFCKDCSSTIFGAAVAKVR